MNALRGLFLNRIGGQIALLILLSLVAIHAFITASLYFSHRNDPQGGHGEGGHELVATIKLVAAAAPSERDAFIAQIDKTFPQFALAQATAATPVHATPHDRRAEFIARTLGSEYTLVPLSDTGNGLLPIAVTLPDRTILTAVLPALREPPIVAGPIMMTILFVVVSVTLLVLWASRVLRSPLSAFAQAAENFSLDDDIAALPERGPEEIRAVARAFNRMRDRIRKLVDDRTRMLAAMGHDLRTPITRLRLRSEFIADTELRSQTLRDLDQMKAMIEAALNFLRDGSTGETFAPIDVASTLQTVCDGYADLGRAVDYDGPAHFTITARPEALQRAVTNLVDNSVRHAGHVALHLSAGPSAIAITVEDDGPGIPDGQKAAMLEPFVRGDQARGMNESAGFGLGLSIAQAVAKAHGGALTLHNRQPRGLIVRIALPTGVPVSTASR